MCCSVPDICLEDYAPFSKSKLICRQDQGGDCLKALFVNRGVYWQCCLSEPGLLLASGSVLSLP